MRTRRNKFMVKQNQNEPRKFSVFFIVIIIITLILFDYSKVYAENKASDLSKKQLTNLMKILGDAYCLGDYNCKTSEYYSVAECLINSGYTLGEKVSSDINGDKIKVSVVDSFMKKYYNITKKESIYKKDSKYFYEKGGYYHVIRGAGELYPEICLINVYKLGQKYSVTYDIYIEQVPDVTISYYETRTAVVGKVPETSNMSIYKISCQGRIGDRSNITYLPMNPRSVSSSGKFVKLEGILIKGKGKRVTGEKYDATILKLSAPIKTTDIEGNRISVKEIHVLPYNTSLDISWYGKKVIVYGETMAGHSQYHARKLLLMNATIYLFNSKN